MLGSWIENEIKTNSEIFANKINAIDKVDFAK